MFPYTEGNAQNVLQPQQQIISSAVPSPSDEMVEISLKEKLNGLTRNESIIDFIFNNLLPEEKYYYDQNFDSVTKNLLNKVRMPVSKEDFIINLAAVLNTDKHKGFIQGIRSYLSAGAPPVVNAPVPGGPPAPAPAPAPAPVPPIPAPRKKVSTASNLSPDEMLKLSVTNLKTIDPKDIASTDDAKKELGDIAFNPLRLATRGHTGSHIVTFYKKNIFPFR